MSGSGLIEIPTNSQLTVGDYHAQFSIPSALLNVLKTHSSWASDAAQYIASNYGGSNVVFEGGGVTNLSETEQVLEVHFRVVTLPRGTGGSSGMSPQQVFLGALALGSIIAALAFALGVVVGQLVPLHLFKQSSGDGSGIGGAIGNVASAFKIFAIAAVIGGVWLLARQFGIGGRK